MNNIIKSQTGKAFIEFSLVLPFLLLMFLGTIDLLTYVGANYKMAAIAENIAESATALDTNPSNLNKTFNEADFATALNAQISQLTTANLFPRYTTGYVIVSDIYNNAGVAKVAWHFCVGNNIINGVTYTSQAAIQSQTLSPILAGANTNADPKNVALTLNNGANLSIDSGEQTIVVEVFGQFTGRYSSIYSALGGKNMSIYKATYAEPTDPSANYAGFVFPNTYTKYCP